MAFPVIVIDSGSGSDTAASGAGPGDGTTSGSTLSGTTNASTNATGLIVTLPSGTDLTNVDTTGLHAVFLNDATAGNRNFSRITAKAGSGGATPTVTVADAFGASLSSKSWAIGGKRATLFGTNSYKLVNNNAGAGDARGGWAVEFASGHAETRSSRWDHYSGGNTTDGHFELRGKAGAATRPVITMSGGSSDIVGRGQYARFKEFDIVGAATAATCFTFTTSNIILERLRISGFSGTLVTLNTAGIHLAQIVGCELDGGTIGIVVDQDGRVLYCDIHDQTSHGIHMPSANLTGAEVIGCVIDSCGGDGIKCVQTRTDMFGGLTIDANTVYGCTGDGIEYTGDNDSDAALRISNNIVANNGGYGVNFVSLTAAKVQARRSVLKGNMTYSNTSGASNLSGVLEDGLDGTDPQFTSAANGDFTIGSNLKALGYPTFRVPSSSSRTSRTYLDPGAAQRQEPAAGGGGGVTGSFPNSRGAIQ